MAIESFQATSYQVGKITRALTSDQSGNLIFRDDLNTDGVTLTELIQDSGSSTTIGGNSGGDTFTISEEDWEAAIYTIGGVQYSGFVYTLNHNLGFKNKYAFTYSIFHSTNNYLITPQQVFPVSTDQTTFVLGSPESVTVSLIGVIS